MKCNQLSDKMFKEGIILKSNLKTNMYSNVIIIYIKFLFLLFTTIYFYHNYLSQNYYNNIII